MQNNLDKKISTRINQHISSLSVDSAGDSAAVISDYETTDKSILHEKKQQKLNAIPAHVRTVHIEHVACPLHIIELTKNLKKIEVSETLKIVVGGHAVALELISACHSLGHDTLVIENDGCKALYVTKNK